jgi:mRNA interferase RelE/StbE
VYTVQLSNRATKELKKVRKEVAKRIIESLELLAVNPYAEVLNFKKLKTNASLFRIRIGDYRVIYEIKADLLIVLVVRVGLRKDVYDYLK